MYVIVTISARILTVEYDDDHSAKLMSRRRRTNHLPSFWRQPPELLMINLIGLRVWGFGFGVWFGLRVKSLSRVAV